VSGLVLAVGTVLRVTSVQRSRRDGDTPSGRVPRRRGRAGIGGPGPLDAGTAVSEAAPLDWDHVPGDAIQDPGPPGAGTTASDAAPLNRDHVRGDDAAPSGRDRMRGDDAGPPNQDHGRGDGDD
jgi:hypothetical protein